MADRDREAARLAQAFHEAYERLAPSFGYETRKASARPWVEVPEPNRKLMEAVCAEVMVPLLAAERAAATAACAEIVQERKHRAQWARILAEQDDCFDFGVEKIVAEIRQWQSVEDEIRALSPEGWCAVRRDDLDVLYQAALVSDHVADDRMDRIRAALARGEGESDG